MQFPAFRPKVTNLNFKSVTLSVNINVHHATTSPNAKLIPDGLASLHYAEYKIQDFLNFCNLSYRGHLKSNI